MTFATTALLARWLGPESFGQYSLAITVASWLLLMAQPGMGPYLNREVSKLDQLQQPSQVSSLVKACLLIAFATSALLTFAVCVFTVATNRQSDELWQLLCVVAIAVPATAVGSVCVSTLLAQRALSTAVLLENLLRTVLLLLVVVIANYVDALDARLMVTVYAAASVFVGAVALFQVGRKLGFAQMLAAKPADLGSVFQQLKPFSLLALVGVFNMELVPLWLGAYSTEELGYLRIALLLSTAVALPLLVVESLVATYITRLYTQKAWRQLNEFIRALTLSVAGASLVPLLLLMVWGDIVIAVVFGQAYGVAYIPMIVLCLGFFVTNCFGVSLQLLYATAYTGHAVRVGMIAAMLNVVMCLVLIPFFGALGAAVAVALGKVLRSFIYLRVWRREFAALRASP